MSLAGLDRPLIMLFIVNTNSKVIKKLITSTKIGIFGPATSIKSAEGNNLKTITKLILPSPPSTLPKTKKIKPWSSNLVFSVEISLWSLEYHKVSTTCSFKMTLTPMATHSGFSSKFQTPSKTIKCALIS